MARRAAPNLEFRCLTALRNARVKFCDDIAAHARNYAAQHHDSGEERLTTDDFDLLRDDAAYQIAEFYYVIEERQLADRQKIEDVLKRHEAAMASLANDKARRDLMGLSFQRIKNARFSPRQQKKIVENVVHGTLRLDETDIGKLLARVMSPETCRKALVVLGKGGLLNRIDTGIQVFMISNGSLENYFRQNLRYIVDSLTEEEG